MFLQRQRDNRLCNLVHRADEAVTAADKVTNIKDMRSLQGERYLGPGVCGEGVIQSPGEKRDPDVIKFPSRLWRAERLTE